MITLETIENQEYTYTLDNKDDILVDHWVEIDDKNEMRLDTIVEAYYGKVDIIDLICLYNGIEAFELKSGDVIALPNETSLLGNVKKSQCRTLNIDPVATSASLNRKTKQKTYTKMANGIIKF